MYAVHLVDQMKVDFHRKSARLIRRLFHLELRQTRLIDLSHEYILPVNGRDRGDT